MHTGRFEVLTQSRIQYKRDMPHKIRVSRSALRVGVGVSCMPSKPVSWERMVFGAREWVQLYSFNRECIIPWHLSVSVYKLFQQY